MKEKIITILTVVGFVLVFFLLPLVALVYEREKQRVYEKALMEQCLEDHKYYECHNIVYLGKLK